MTTCRWVVIGLMLNLILVTAPSLSAALRQRPACKDLSSPPMPSPRPVLMVLTITLTPMLLPVTDRLAERSGNLLGKVFRMPKIQYREDGRLPLLIADAAFVAYPHPSTPDCSYTYKEYDQFSRGKEYCLDVGSGEYLERVAPLRVRGADNAVHPVIGSAASTEGLAIQLFGARSGEALRATVETAKVLSVTESGLVSYLSTAFETLTQGGDSGAPIYTVPDAAGNVRIVGVLVGATSTGEAGNWRHGILFSTWSDVEAALDLKPLSAPASAGPTEDDLASLFSAFD